MNVGLIGCGYWGPNLARNIHESGRLNLAWVADTRNDRLKLVHDRWSQTRTTTDYKEILNDPDVIAVVVATPPSTHRQIVEEAIAAGKNVMVTKPLANSVAESQHLADMAENAGVNLMVDHTFLFSDAVIALRNLVESGEIGDILYYDSVRINLGLFQHDTDVVWDLAVHDLSILNWVCKQLPQSVSATAMFHGPNQFATGAYMTLFYESSLVAHIHVNWLAPVKIRRTILSGAKKMVVYDDLEPSDKIKIFDKGVQFTDSESDIHSQMVSYRTGDVVIPNIGSVEALSREMEHFADCLEGRVKPIADARSAVSIATIIEAASLSLSQNGTPIDISYSG
jgi:predicted dehydrogenase